ncbi:DUF4169 family protein [Fulvimarina sp. MAC8]|uniref:DUF4169 family protein n=1 Tax=Fulvimarina sp. MAC8 TaxID=3162874 RepID=UPI0032ECAE42
MGDIVNLRRARKAKARDDREAEAADNRVKFGTPPALRSLEEARKTKAEKALDGHKLSTDKTCGRDETDLPDDPA